jgi:thiol-disulfide isomerase/thioredoxin
MKTVLMAGMLLSLFFLPETALKPANAKDRIMAYYFWAEGCPHCKDEKVFLTALQQKYPQLEIRSFEVKKNRENAALFTRIAETYSISIKGVPATFIGGLPPIIGYLGDRSSGRDIEQHVLYCRTNTCNDPMTKLEKAVLPVPADNRDLLASDEGLCKQNADCPEEPAPPAQETLITLPLIGTIDAAKTALSYQTLLIAGLDSFNPCAFFVLFTLLGLLIHVQSRKRLLLVGGIFVFFSGFVYFIFMAAWLNIFLLTGQVAAVTIAAGAIALIIAAINIKDFFFFKKGVSLSIPDSAKPKLFDRMRKLIKANSFPAIVTGTVVLAIAANAYELFCTAGFPMVYTRILTLHNLPKTSYYLYLLFYNAIYVIPLALVVIFVAVTLGAKKLSESQGQILKLISGMMMLCLGLVLLIKPELLNNILATTGMLAASLLLSAAIVLISGKVVHGVQ